LARSEWDSQQITNIDICFHEQTSSFRHIFIHLLAAGPPELLTLLSDGTPLMNLEHQLHFFLVLLVVSSSKAYFNTSYVSEVMLPSFNRTWCPHANKTHHRGHNTKPHFTRCYF
jgi:hypothetical protein